MIEELDTEIGRLNAQLSWLKSGALNLYRSELSSLIGSSANFH